MNFKYYLIFSLVNRKMVKTLSMLQKILAAENEVRNNIENAKLKSQNKIKENNKLANDEANKIISDARKEEEKILSKALSKAEELNLKTKKELEDIMINFKKENKDKIESGFNFVLERIESK
ncbi:MAG TPA: hypothetical protein GXZ51_02935 [Acholeplasma sp.]|nr:hypothetical protein [Acholeplasma sp.]